MESLLPLLPILRQSSSAEELAQKLVGVGIDTVKNDSEIREEL